MKMAHLKWIRLFDDKERNIVVTLVLLNACDAEGTSRTHIGSLQYYMSCKGRGKMTRWHLVLFRGWV